MQQTFHYLCRGRQAGAGWFGFVLWTFVETAVGIVREYALLLTKGATMKNIFANPTSAAITSSILSLPLGLTFAAFMLDIEPFTKVLNNLFTIDGQQINMLGRIVIYGGLLLLPLAFVLNLRAMLKRREPEGKRRLYTVNLIVGVVIILLITVTWGALFVEQIYCLRAIRCD